VTSAFGAAIPTAQSLFYPRLTHTDFPNFSTALAATLPACRRLPARGTMFTIIVQQ